MPAWLLASCPRSVEFLIPHFVGFAIQAVLINYADSLYFVRNELDLNRSAVQVERSSSDLGVSSRVSSQDSGTPFELKEGQFQRCVPLRKG